MKRRTTCVRVTWASPAAGEPNDYYDEIGADRWSVRCVRGYADGARHAFHKSSYLARDLMPEAPIPTIKEINADPQFKAKHLSAQDFDAIWAAVYGLNRQSMLEPILDALPQFRPHWDRFVTEWANSQHTKGPANLPLYLVIATLAKFLVVMLEQNETQAFGAVFAIVEHWLLHGDKYVYDAAGAGLLEDLQNPVHYKRLTPDAFKPWLGIQTLKSWEALTPS